MIWEVYHTRESLSTLGRPSRRNDAMVPPIGIGGKKRPCARKEKNRNGAVRGLRQPVRNPYERGTAGPPFRGVLPGLALPIFRAARSFFATNHGPPTGPRGKRPEGTHSAAPDGPDDGLPTRYLCRAAPCATMGVGWRHRPRESGTPRQPHRSHSWLSKKRTRSRRPK